MILFRQIGAAVEVVELVNLFDFSIFGVSGGRKSLI
jgi:hypothetical protein